MSLPRRKLNVIFPAAGDGMRFGGTAFKPFLDATEKKFIELAKEPFHIFSKDYDVTYYFICRVDQEESFEVRKTLQKLFPTEALEIIVLPTKTKGPLETLQAALQLKDIQGLSFVCDCDHSIQLKPFYKLLETQKIEDIVLPIWPIEEDEQASWAKVKLSSKNDIVSYHEKEFVPTSSLYKVCGIIGPLLPE